MDDDHTVRPALLAVLAQRLLPLLANRGQRVTHDLNRFTLLINLRRQASGSVALSHFDKAALGCTEIVHLRQVSAPAQRIQPKGWWVDLTPQSEDALWPPVNRTAAQKERAPTGRSALKRQLSDPHKTLLTALAGLLPPQTANFDAVFLWSWQQAEVL